MEIETHYLHNIQEVGGTQSIPAFQEVVGSAGGEELASIAV